MEPRFEPLASTSGLAIIDPIESRRFSLLTPEVVSASPADPDDFYFPVSSACSIRVSEIELLHTVSVYVREPDGTMVTDVEPPANLSLSEGSYLIELSSPVKIYLRVQTELEIHSNTDYVQFSFDNETTVTVGARSLHKSPAGTVTVPDDSEQMMAGLSALSSSLKTKSPERSFPTLRGHPPRIKRGEHVDIPDELSRPDTGISIEIPPNYGHIFPVAPLTFYLGAELVSGSVPRIRTDTGFQQRLDSIRGFEEEVERILKQTFFLDCIVRTEGYYPVELAEREKLEPRLNFDFADLYNRPLAERIETYLNVSYSAIKDELPPWHRVTFVRPEAKNVELLPYLINDLSLIRTSPDEESVAMDEGGDDVWTEIDEFQRDSPMNEGPLFRGVSADEFKTITRTQRSREDTRPDRNYVTMPEKDTIEQAWAGDGIPTNGTKLLPPAYKHEQTVPDNGVIDITVVCNDSRMRSEWDTVSEIYESRDEISIETTVEFGIGKERLRDLLRKSTDLFHYIGHVDDRGFDCLDGFLDAKTLDEVGTRSFILNACNSLDQGEGLIEAGASAGIVSLSEVSNRGAIEIGETLARLLHHGFSIGGALVLARKHSTIGSRYIGIGDVGLTFSQCKDSGAIFYEITSEANDSVTVDIHAYPNRHYQIGSFVVPYILKENTRYLYTVQISEVDVDRSKFEGFADNYLMPFIVEDELVWSDEWSSDLS